MLPVLLLLLLLLITSSFAATMQTVRIERINHLFEIYNTLSIRNQRSVAGIVGAAVGDAAARPFHWLYDRKKLEEIVGDTNPAFFPINCSPFYDLPTGRRSCYNDLGLCMLRSLPYKKDKLIKSIVSLFNPPSEYATAFADRQMNAPYNAAKRLDERIVIKGPWQQQSVTVFLDCYNKNEPFTGNPEVKETDGLVVTLPLICQLANNDVITEAASLLSSNPFCIQHTLVAGEFLKHIIINNKMPNIDEMIRLVEKNNDNNVEESINGMIEQELQEVEDCKMNNINYIEAVSKWGTQCANPQSFQSAILATTTSTSYEEGIKKCILAGGCNCSRANLCGALLGATYLIGTKEGIPLDWMYQTDLMEEIFELAIVNCV